MILFVDTCWLRRLQHVDFMTLLMVVRKCEEVLFLRYNVWRNGGCLFSFHFFTNLKVTFLPLSCYHPISRCLNFTKEFCASGLVNMSTIWSSVSTATTSIFPFLTSSQKWWYTRLMCLVWGLILGTIIASTMLKPLSYLCRPYNVPWVWHTFFEDCYPSILAII